MGTPAGARPPSSRYPSAKAAVMHTTQPPLPSASCRWHSCQLPQFIRSRRLLTWGHIPEVAASGPLGACLLPSPPSPALLTGSHLPLAPFSPARSSQPEWRGTTCSAWLYSREVRRISGGGSTTTSLTPTNLPDASLTTVEKLRQYRLCSQPLKRPLPRWELWARMAFPQGVRTELDICIGPPSGRWPLRKKPQIFLIPSLALPPCLLLLEKGAFGKAEFSSCAHWPDLENRPVLAGAGHERP